ncbi:hypothetical protein Cni_G18850 [Canna indica]|uniref:Uncharacterized protein n=1 Tax=Canna indica TaxID=4628 RepID=A0AAQ3QHZ6_9LILI|nr:hypothetical protein Cni_G18850 [Canna indica]
MEQEIPILQGNMKPAAASLPEERRIAETLRDDLIKICRWQTSQLNFNLHYYQYSSVISHQHVMIDTTATSTASIFFLMVGYNTVNTPRPPSMQNI